MNIFKKFLNKEKTSSETVEIDEEALQQQIIEHEEKLKNSDDEDLTETLNALGKLYYQLGNIDKSIEYYERSISQEKALGSSFTELMKLYNIKRKEAVEAKNDAEVQEYLTKIDALMQLSKDVMRGRI
ncbi:tetratricopeptide repeat protein [Salinicoccus hispanicus]|uniref:Tetratricopeptide repeat protein n=1 Tax=Salinicoccus hispanicus TaxID=157225 RepID=A0A6N8U3J1_9STAP|nr:tetratricopeptide repeat protein [Salinicoccus hispanicus]MXQ51626.1 tetratricopeptide repeat protein [Salinicoccus hispanicus]